MRRWECEEREKGEEVRSLAPRAEPGAPRTLRALPAGPTLRAQRSGTVGLGWAAGLVDAAQGYGALPGCSRPPGQGGGRTGLPGHRGLTSPPSRRTAR